tara:strand:+ start:1864 stop:2055 length:192 start_codon:yes stop_codon:yes gene_type:complete
MKNKRLKFNSGELVYYKDFASLQKKKKKKNNIEIGHYLSKKSTPGLPGLPDNKEINIYIKKKF